MGCVFTRERRDMPMYDYLCDVCGESQEVLALMGELPPTCCGAVMRRTYGTVAIRDSQSLTGSKHQLFMDRINDIHKRQEQKGERLRFVHPREVL